ncbi:hypothetical protein [Lactobacillus sp. ESL0681]|uniref:hypothetical protein n=1 Tax=Lactobacillus sp. ESL0681 TaxID=2983211 RepID=UPI0023F84981|nr:hypothetical protein [Lactobacillus sp. ESL0681]WEV41152.1 hypothetical protein OZX59_04335 [Lactobacillus sp. ESL0681]
MSEFDQIVLAFFKNYHDRGMQKWQGYFLSDHTLSINQQKRRNAVHNSLKPAMSLEDIGCKLLEAYSNHKVVRVQLKELNEDKQPPADLVGFVTGYDEESIIIAEQKVALTNINNIEIDQKKSFDIS